MVKMLKTPLFWDTHLHGVAGIDFMHANVEEMLEASRILFKHGIGYYAPTLLTSSIEDLEAACFTLGYFIQIVKNNQDKLADLARPIGIHLEGPFLNPAKSGAHDRKFLMAPDIR